MKKLLVFLMIFLTAAVVFAQQKFALVIGNGAYRNTTPLNNPVNDANDMEAALRSLGFTVDKLTNASQSQMENAVMQLKRRLSANQNSYGFLFYAGHGVQSNGENFLIPVDADIPSENYLRNRAVSVQVMLDELNDAGNVFNVVVLDACRDNPFSWRRSGTRGLSVVGQQPTGSIIVYATAAGSTAADGTGRNGLFTTHLLRNLRIPGLEINEVFRRTMGDVATASNNQQHPAIYNQFAGTVYLNSPPDSRPDSIPTPQPATPRQTNFSMNGFYVGGEFKLDSFSKKDMGLIPYIGYGNELLRNLDFFTELAFDFSLADNYLNFALWSTTGLKFGFLSNPGRLYFGVDLPIRIVSSVKDEDPFHIELELIAGIESDKKINGEVRIGNILHSSEVDKVEFFNSITIGAGYDLGFATIGVDLWVPLYTFIRKLSIFDGITITPGLDVRLSSNFNIYAQFPISNIAGYSGSFVWHKDTNIGLIIGAEYSF